jgi:hypothetical protein
MVQDGVQCRVLERGVAHFPSSQALYHQEFDGNDPIDAIVTPCAVGGIGSSGLPTEIRDPH